MRLEVGDPFFVFTYTNSIKGSHSIEVIYFARFVGSIESIKLNPEDHAEYGWFAETELEQAYTENKPADAIEFTAVRKGFAILRVASLTT